MSRSPATRGHAALALGLALAFTLALPGTASAQGKDSWRAHRVDLELALFPSFTQRQIESPDRDDVVVDEPMLAVVAAATYRIVRWFEAGLYLHFDVGSSERVLYDAPDATGTAAERARIEGSFWELWTVILTRFRYGPMFFELGWAPLMLRHDSTRDDLPNADGETDGTFVGSRSVAFLVGVGGRVELMERLDLTLRLELRIRYLVSRGGSDLADDAEFGQMTAWPFVGVAYRF